MSFSLSNDGFFPISEGRFNEFIREIHEESAFAEKYSVSISIHCYDHTVHINYIRTVAEDMGTIFFSSFLTEMQNLLKGEKPVKIVSFIALFLKAVE